MLTSASCQVMICCSVNYPPQYSGAATHWLEEDSTLRTSGMCKVTWSIPRGDNQEGEATVHYPIRRTLHPLQLKPTKCTRV